MPKIQTPNSMAAITVLPGAANYRLVGLEITPAAGAPRVYHLVNIDTATSDVEAHLRSLAQGVAPALVKDQLPHNITIDRCYIHGSDQQDVRQGIIANGTAVAVIDSYISDIHDSTMDSQGIFAYRTPGPIKIVNNFISSTTENIMFGGAGGATNLYVPSDIEIRRNWLYKPLSWIPMSTIPPFKWTVKNNLEFKSGQRAIVTGNLLENNWASGQMGFAVVLTPRTATANDCGPNSVVDDIVIESNILRNVVSGFSTLAQDDGCKPPGCKWPGEEKRVKIDNNLILFMPSTSAGWARNWGLIGAVNLTDVVFQHNTMVLADYSGADQSLYFIGVQGWPWPPSQSYTHNLWVLDNVLSRQPSGDSAGLLGTRGLTYYMGDPAPVDKRFMGNVMYVPPGDTMPSYPPKNSLQAKIAFADPAAGNYQLTAPKWTQTSDGALAGINNASLQAAMNPDVGP